MAPPPSAGADSLAVNFTGDTTADVAVLQGLVVFRQAQLRQVTGSSPPDVVGSVFAGSYVDLLDTSGATPLPFADQLGTIEELAAAIAATDAASTGSAAAVSGLETQDVPGMRGGVVNIACPGMPLADALQKVARMLDDLFKNHLWNDASACKVAVPGSSTPLACSATQVAAAMFAPTKLLAPDLYGMNAPADPTDHDLALLQQLGVQRVRVGLVLPTDRLTIDDPKWDSILAKSLADLEAGLKRYAEKGVHVTLLLGPQMVPGAVHGPRGYLGSSSAAVYDQFCHPEVSTVPGSCDPNAPGCLDQDGWGVYKDAFLRRMREVLDGVPGSTSGIAAMKGADGRSVVDEYELWNEPDSRGNAPLKEACYVSLLTAAKATLDADHVSAGFTSGIASVNYYSDLAQFSAPACTTGSERSCLKDPFTGQFFSTETKKLLSQFTRVDLHPYNEWPAASTPQAYANQAMGYPPGTQQKPNPTLPAAIDELDHVFKSLGLGTPKIGFTEWGNQVGMTTCNDKTMKYDQEQKDYIKAMFDFLRGGSKEASQVEEASFFALGNEVCPMGLTYDNRHKLKPDSFAAYEAESTAVTKACSNCAALVLADFYLGGPNVQLPAGCMLPTALPLPPYPGQAPTSTSTAPATSGSTSPPGSSSTGSSAPPQPPGWCASHPDGTTVCGSAIGKTGVQAHWTFDCIGGLAFPISETCSGGSP